jgi:hypothetical protein
MTLGIRQKFVIASEAKQPRSDAGSPSMNFRHSLLLSPPGASIHHFARDPTDNFERS